MKDRRIKRMNAKALIEIIKCLLIYEKEHTFKQ
jgi:hypothetical protein